MLSRIEDTLTSIYTQLSLPGMWLWEVAVAKKMLKKQAEL